MGTLFLVLTAVLFSASYVNQNKMMTLQNAQSSNVIPFLFGIMWSLLTACGWWITIIIQGDWTFIPMDILFAAIGGITAGACNLCYVMSLYHGPLSLSSVTLGLGPIVAVVLAVIFLGQLPTGIQFVGLGLTIVVMIIVNMGPVDKRPTLKWFLLAFGAFAMYGLQLFTFNMHYAYVENPNNAQFMGMLYIFCALTFAVGFFVMKNKTRDDAAETELLSKLNYKLIFLFAVIQAATNGIANALYVKAAADIPAVVLYPTVETGSMLLTSLVAFIFFKEKLTKTGIIALILGCAAVFLLNM